MSGKFLKARQLAKEMEEKAKKTAEEKKQITESLIIAEAILEESEKSGVDVGEAKKLVEDARALIDERELDDSLDKVEKALEILRESNTKRINELIEGTEELHELIVDEERYAGSLELLKKTHELIDEDKFKEALDSAKESLELSLLEIQEKFNEDVSSIESSISVLSSKGKDISEQEELMNKAKKAMEEQDYETAFNYLKGCKAKLGEGIDEFLNERIAKIEDQIKIVRDTGNNPTDVEESISKAKVKAKEGDFEGGMVILKDAQAQLDESMVDVVQTKLEELDNEITRAKEIDSELDVVNALRKQVLELQASNEYSEAYNILSEAFEKVEEAKFHRVLRTIAESRDSFIKAKDIGIDISEPMNLLSKARDELKEGNHKAALEWANSGKEKVKELVKEHDEATAKIEKALNLVDEMKEINIEIPDSSEQISKAEAYLAENDYEAASKVIDEFEETTGKIVYEKILELVEEYEMAIVTAEELAISVAEHTDRLEDIIALTKSGQYGQAGRNSIGGAQELMEIISQEMDKKLENFNEIIERIKNDLGEDDDVSELEKLEKEIQGIDAIIEEGRYREANRILKDISASLNKWHVGEADDAFTKAKEIFELIKELDIDDIDVDTYGKDVKKAEEALEKDEFSTVIQISNKLIKEMNSNLRKTAEAHFADAKMEVVKAKKAGVTIEDLRKKLIDCKKNIREEVYTKAIKLSREIADEAVKLREKRKNSYEIISKLSGELTELKRKGVINDAGPAKKILLEAKECFQNRDYTQAERLAEQAVITMEELQKQQLFDKELNVLKERVSEAEKLGVDTSEEESIIQVASSDARRGEYEGSVEIVQEATEHLYESLKKHVKPKIEKTRDILRSAKEIDIDVSGPEKILAQAEKLWEKGDFKGTLDKVEECQKKIDEIRNKSRKAAGEVKRVKERMEEAKDIHADVKESEKVLLKALDALKKDQYDLAISEAVKAEKMIIKSERDRVKNLLSSFKEKIEETRRQGVNTALADNLIRRAYKAMENGNYMEAINLAMQSEGELERIELQQDISKRSISSTNDKVESAKSNDIKVDDAEKLLNQAKQAYRSGFYVKAFDNAIKSVDKLNDTVRTYKEADKLLNNMEEFSDTADVLGLETTDMRDAIQEGKIAFEKGRYDKALSNAKKAESALMKHEPKMPDLIKEVESNIESLKEKGKDTTRAEELIKQSNISFGIGDTFEAMRLLSEAKEEFGGEIFDEYNKNIDEVESLVTKAKKFGADVGAVETLIKDAKNTEKEDITLARDKAKEALDKVEESLKPYSPALDIWVEGRLMPDKGNKIKIGIKNTGAGVAKAPALEFEGCNSPEIELPPMLKAGEEMIQEVEVKPKEDIVVIKVTGTRIFDDKTLEASIGVKTSTGEFEITKSDGAVKCTLCKGVIQKDLDMIKCECGQTYHKTCGEREKNCKECGTLFEKKKEKKASKRVALKI